MDCRLHDQEVVRPVSSNASSEANQQAKIRDAIINLSITPIIQPSSISTVDVGTLPEYPDKKFVTTFPLIIRDELMEDHDMTMNPGREKVWRDSYLTNRPSIHLHRLIGSNLLELCKDVLTGLTHEMTERRAANIMLLAWNMRQFDTVSHVFPVKNPCAAASDIGINTLTKRVFNKSGKDPYVRPKGIEDDEYVAACAYISASTLRLFSESADNYMIATDKHIPHMFYMFYNISFPLTEFKPDRKCIKALKLIYTTKTVYRNTLAPFLYEFKGLKDAKGMCQMLYEQELAFAGIFAISLYMRACFGLHASLIQLGSCLWHMMTKETLISLCRICRTYALDPSLENSRATWKYARLYNTGYFPLPENSKIAACCLAIICMKLGISENQDLMHIAQLRKLDLFWKSSNVWANRTVAWFRANASPRLGPLYGISSMIRDDAPSKKRVRDDETQHTRVTKSTNWNLAPVAILNNSCPQHGHASSDVRGEDIQEPLESLNGKSVTALSTVSAKENLLKQHAEVTVESLAGWEQAEAEITALKILLEAASQKNVCLVDLVDVVSKKSGALESENSKLKSHIAELKDQLEAAKSETSIMHARHNLQGKLQAAEKGKFDLKTNLFERDLSNQVGETARNQHLESVKRKVARLGEECRR